MAIVPNIEMFHHFLPDNLQSTLNVTISKSVLGGRGLFANKFLKKGSLVFINRPIVFGPRANCTIEKFCCTCHQVNDSCYSCEKCHAFICSKKCNNSSQHKQICSFISKYWSLKETTKTIETVSIILGRMLIYLQFLVLPEEHKKILRLFQQNDIKSLEFEELKLLQMKFSIPQHHVDFINMVHSIMKINCFRISNSHDSKIIELRGFYPLSAFMNHACIPNTRNIFTSEYLMAVIASKDIEKGDEITCCYTGILWCSQVRRLQLYKAKQFWCKCSRCSDKTEKGTNLSALKCLNKECIGILLPKTPLSPLSKWLCDTCLAIVSLEEINMIHSVLGSLVGVLKLDDKNKINLNKTVLRRLAEFVPFSNHIFLDIRMRLAIKLGFMEGCFLYELSESRLDLKESLCRSTLRTVAALGAGDAYLRGLLLYHLHAALAERARRSPDLYEELKSEIENTIEQAYNILQGDLSAPPDLELRRQYLGPGCDKPHEEKFTILDSPERLYL